MNLCTNAYHAMEANGGVLRVCLSHRILDEDYIASEFDEQGDGIAPGHYARIDVRDTGYGMDEATRQRIFDPYFTTKEPGSGTGLGLATVHGIVKELKGFVYVYSEKDIGSTFSVFLPVTSEATRGEGSPMARVEGGSNERILFVDDDESICRFAEKSLTRLGYDVTYFSDPETAVAAFCENPEHFDVIITDEIMPKMRGRELLEKVRAGRPDVPVILYSGFAEPKHASVQSGDEEFSAQVLKPMITQELADVIRNVLKKSTT